MRITPAAAHGVSIFHKQFQYFDWSVKLPGAYKNQPDGLFGSDMTLISISDRNRRTHRTRAPMVDEARKAEMRQYQQLRSAIRRQHGLATRTFWIWEADNDAFRDAIAPFVDRARLIEALLGTVPLPSLELVQIIQKHGFPYDPEDVVFLAGLRTTIALKPLERTRAEQKARDILEKYNLPISLEDLVE
jgi:hypothetical protein